jgi:hypothetical protein
MEGTFTYAQGRVSDYIANAIYKQKTQYKILSLCEQPNNMLMWSYYGEGHTGMVVGVELGNRTRAESVEYVDDFDLADLQGDPARTILLRKHRSWEHEKEHRVLTNGDSFVSVRLRELVFGVSADKEKQRLIASVAKKFNPGVKISQMTTRRLDAGRGRRSVA